MDELEAINLLLRAIGSAPVNDPSANHPDVANAKKALERQAQRFQRRGWWFNESRGEVFTPMGDGRIKIAKEVSLVEMHCPQIIQRGEFLYNQETATGIFDGEQKSNRVIRTFAWEMIPQVCREYIAYNAGVEFLRDEVGDEQRIQEFRTEAAIQYVEVRRQDLRLRQDSMWENRRLASFRALRRPAYHGGF